MDLNIKIVDMVRHHSDDMNPSIFDFRRLFTSKKLQKRLPAPKNNVKMDKIENVVDPHFREGATASNLEFNEKVKSLIKSGRDVAHFAFGQSPFPVPDCFQEQLKAFAHTNEYLPVKGTSELREALSEFHSRYDDLPLDSENFILGPGSKEIISIVMNVFNGVILVPSPCWTTYEPQVRLARKRPLVLATDQALGWKLTPTLINKGTKHLAATDKNSWKLLILTNPGNPTGTSYTEKELKDISECCRENKIIVLSDEIYSRITFTRKHYSLLKYYPEGTIMTNGFSKWASVGGWRIGYAYIPPSMSSLYDAVIGVASHTYSCAPAPMQHAIAKVLVNNVVELNDYMNDCSAILKLVSDYCYTELSSVGITGHRSEAGYYYMPDFEVIREGLAKRGIKTGVEMTKVALEEANVAMMGSELFLRPAEELSVRFCFVCFDGRQALTDYRSCKQNGVSLHASNEEGKRFLEQNCALLLGGIARLKSWVLKHRNSAV